MKLYASLDRTKPEIVAEHNGERVAFSANVFTRKAFERDFDVFEYINKFWAKQLPQLQDQVWFVYKEIYRGFEQILSAEELYRFLNHQVGELLRLHDLRALQSSLAQDPTVMVPPSVHETFVPSPESNNTREKTYIRSDYMELAAVSLFMRCLVPVWGEYINSTRKDAGVDYKEQLALQLLNGTGLLETPAIKKLLVYIHDNTKEKHSNPDKILRGVSSEDMDFLLLALVCIRRLCVADLRGHDPTSHIVSKAFNFVYHRTFNPSKTDTPVKAKPFGNSESATEQTKHSILESYRKRTELSFSDIISMQHSWRDYYGAVLRLAPELPEDALVPAFTTAQALRKERVADAQKVIASWLFKTVHVPFSIYYLEKEDLWKAMATAETILWHWDMKYLAVLMTCHPVIGQEELHITPFDHRAQLPDSYKEEIYKLYPYVWSSSRRTGAATTQEPHAILHAIDKVVDDLIANAWRSTASQARVEQVFGDFRRKFPIIPGIKAELARLIIEVEQRRR